MMQDFSVIIPVKDRRPQLEQCLEGLAIQRPPPFTPREIIVVDYGCSQGTWDYCKTVPGITAIRVLDNVRWFNIGRARNIGANHATEDVLVFVDGDVECLEGFFQEILRPIFSNQAGLVHIGCGTCAVLTSVFHDARGYDERFTGYGLDSIDFWRRCGQITPAARYRPKFHHHVHHDEKAKVANYQEKNIKRNILKQKEITGEPSLVYGQGPVEIFPEK
jgi:glycosyltransferase involved in cell wall biosynthesis